MKRWLLLAPLLAGCPRLYRVTEGVTATRDHRIGGEVTATAGRFVTSSDHAGLAVGLRAGVALDGDGVTAIVGVAIDAVRLPPRRPAGFAEDTEPMSDPPSGPGLRVGVHAGTTIGGELAVMWSSGRVERSPLGLGGERRDARYRSLGVELGGDHPIGGATFGALRIVEEWDRMVAIDAGAN